LHWGTLAVAAPFVAAALLGAAPAARANCYSFTNVSGSERYLNFSYNHPIAGAPAYVKLEPNDRYPSSGHPYCVDDPETRIEVYLGAGGAIVGWDGAQVIGNGSTLGFMMGDDSIATPGGDYKID
jgi:hypothetical protein